MSLIEKDTLINNWQEKICWGVRCVDCPMLGEGSRCKIEEYFNEQPIIDSLEAKDRLLDLYTERCEGLRKQLRDAHENYEKHLNELQAKLDKERNMKIHNIKLRIEFCDAVMNGEKTFEIRENDRGYQKGDHIRFTPVSSSPYQCFPYHAIQEREYEITYVLNGWGLKDGFVVLAIKETERSEICGFQTMIGSMLTERKENRNE